MSVRVELLTVPDCPHVDFVGGWLRAAVHDVGMAGVDIVTAVIDTQQMAEQRSFIGSPTILIDGADPFGEPGSVPAVACRVRPHPSGPDDDADLRTVRRALKEAAAAHTA